MSTDQGAQWAGDIPFGSCKVPGEVPLCVTCNDSTPAVTALNFPRDHQCNLDPTQNNHSGQSSSVSLEDIPANLTNEAPPMLRSLIGALWGSPDPTHDEKVFR